MMFRIKKNSWIFVFIIILIVIYLFFSIILSKISIKQLDIFTANPERFNNTLWISEDPKAYFVCKKGTLIKNGQIIVKDDVYNFNLLTQMTAYYIDIDNYDIHSICKMSVEKEKNKEIKFKIVGDPYNFFEDYSFIAFKSVKFDSEVELNEALEKIRYYPSNGGTEYGIYFSGE